MRCTSLLGHKDVSIFYKSLGRECALIIYKSRIRGLRIYRSGRRIRRKEEESLILAISYMRRQLLVTTLNQSSSFTTLAIATAR
jgi:hypothetical protein